MQQKLNRTEPEAKSAASAPRSLAHAKLREHRDGPLAEALRAREVAREAMEAAQAEVRKCEDDLTGANERRIRAVLASDRAAYGEAETDCKFHEQRIKAAAERAKPLEAAYAQASATVNAPFAESKNLLASALLAEVGRVAGELDTVLREKVAPPLRLLTAIQDWFSTQQIPGVAMEQIMAARRGVQGFVTRLNDRGADANAKAELATLIKLLNE